MDLSGLVAAVAGLIVVSLREEGVDLSKIGRQLDRGCPVSLREEGVDLSQGDGGGGLLLFVSLREEGVDLSNGQIEQKRTLTVSLREEGVDLSFSTQSTRSSRPRLPPRGGSGFKRRCRMHRRGNCRSPSARREWI